MLKTPHQLCLRSLRTLFRAFVLVPVAAMAQVPGTQATSEFGAAATVHPAATRAAMQALQEGGTAIDGAIAAALTLGVVDGFNSGLGGGLFSLVRFADGEIQALDAREMAPQAATEDMFIRNGEAQAELSKTGALAIGIPGAVLAFEQLHERAGALPLATHYKRAATIAEQGFAVTPHYASRIQRTQENIQRFPETAALFLNSAGQPWPAGHVLKQPDLARSYRALAEQGSDWFYKGEFAQKTEQWMQANDGLISREDFAAYYTVSRAPIQTHFHGYQFVGFPPPSSGGIAVAQMLRSLEGLNYAAQPKTERTHLLAEVMRLAFADRSRWLGDPDYFEVPDWLLSADYLSHRLTQLDRKAASENIQPGQADFFKHTSHIAVADALGNWVSLTTSLNTSFGSKVTIPGTGIVLNNQMDDFAADPGTANLYGLVQGQANAVAPGKRPLSSMTPALVLKKDEPILALGAAGGPLIISQVIQAIAHHLLTDLPLNEAIAHYRVHHQWQPNVLFIEKTLPAAQRKALEAKGHELKELRFEGSTNAVGRLSGQWIAVSEPRMVRRNTSGPSE